MSRSSFINLYSSEDVSDDSKKVRMDAKSADFTWSGVQELKMDFGAFKLKQSGQADYYDLESRFAAIEGDQSSSNNAAAITQLQQDLAAETTSRTSGDTSNSNLIASETTARTTADQTLQANIDAEAVAARAAEQANATAIASEAASRAAAVSAEEQARVAAVASLQSQITNILSNADASVIDSIAELLNKVDTEDASLLAAIQALQADHDALKARVDALTAQ